MTDKTYIHKNIGEPPSSALEAKYPFKKLEIGDAFDQPIEETDRVRWMRSYVQRTTKMRFATRVFKQAGIIRVWRIKDGA